MYKEIIVCLLIIITIFILDYNAQRYTDISINDAINDIKDIEECIKLKKTKNEEMVNKVNDNYEKWLNRRKYLAYFLEHNELEKVETGYIVSKSFVENQKYEEALSELEKTIFVLNHINEKYSINLANIF